MCIRLNRPNTAHSHYSSFFLRHSLFAILYSFFVILYSLFFILYSPPLFAQDIATPAALPSPTPVPPIPDGGISLLVSPPILDLRTEPESSASANIKIKNNSNGPEALTISIKKFKADSTGSKPVLEDLSQTDIFPQWLSFSEPSFTIDSKQWKTIKVSFAPPANAAPAYYFALVFTRQQKLSAPGQAATQGEAAILCLVQVSSSRVYHQLDLQQLDANTFGFKTDRKIYEFLPVNFITTLDNKGNVHEIASGNIFIDWTTGNKQSIDILNVNPDGSAILPQTTRTFTNEWINGFPVWETIKDPDGNPILNKNGQPKRKLKWDFSKLASFRIGKYSATLVMAYNDGVRDIPLEAQTSFWVIPWRILLVLLIILILIIIGMRGVIMKAWDKAKQTRNRFHRPPPPPIPTNTGF